MFCHQVDGNRLFKDVKAYYAAVKGGFWKTIKVTFYSEVLEEGHNKEVKLLQPMEKVAIPSGPLLCWRGANTPVRTELPTQHCICD